MEHYVYVYFDPIINCDDIMKLGIFKQPIYIGKGKDGRFDHHWNQIRSHRKLTNPLFTSRLELIRDSGNEPIILKISENLTDGEAKILEKKLISEIGRKIHNKGPLLNISEGGDGGITWVGENPKKGKSLETLYGYVESERLKKILSESAKSRTGDKNPMFGKTGENSPLYGFKSDESTRNKISTSLKKFFNSCDPEYISLMVNKMNLARENVDPVIKETWYAKQSEIMKKKYESGEIFTESHRINLSKNNYRKNNSGSYVLNHSEETKRKISKSLKNVKLSESHRNNLKTFDISYDDLKKLISDVGLKSKIEYREYIKSNNIKAPISPGKKIYGEKWEGWKKFLNKR
jgi:hypothetical protein